MRREAHEDNEYEALSAGDHLTNLAVLPLLGVFVVLSSIPSGCAGASISDPTYVNSGALITCRGCSLHRVTVRFDQPQLWIGYGNTLCYTLFGTLFGLACASPRLRALPAGPALPRDHHGILVFTMYFNAASSDLRRHQQLNLGHTRILLISWQRLGLQHRAHRTLPVLHPEELREAAASTAAPTPRFFFSSAAAVQGDSRGHRV